MTTKQNQALRLLINNVRCNSYDLSQREIKRIRRDIRALTKASMNVPYRLDCQAAMALDTLRKCVR